MSYHFRVNHDRQTDFTAIVEKIILFGSPTRTSYLRFFDTFRLSLTVFGYDNSRNIDLTATEASSSGKNSY